MPYVNRKGNTIELDYTKIVIKHAYDELPKISYPLITIQEIENTENTRFTDNQGEHISNNAYQIEVYDRKKKEMEATESVTFLIKTINNLLTGPNYKLTRIGGLVSAPLISDRTVMRGVKRYTCSIDLDNNIIYKRS